MINFYFKISGTLPIVKNNYSQHYDQATIVQKNNVNGIKSEEF